MFQLPDNTRIHLPRLREKACSFTPGEVCFYEATFLSGLRFHVHPFIMKLLHHLGIAPEQLMPNSWWIAISCMEIWMIVTEGDMIQLDKFVFLYRLKESKEFGYYELVPWDMKSRLVVNLPSSFCYWKSIYFLCLEMVGKLPWMIFGVTFPSWSVGGGQSLVCHLLCAIFWRRFSSSLFVLNLTFLIIYFVAKVHPKLKNRYKGHVKDASDYAKTIETLTSWLILGP